MEQRSAISSKLSEVDEKTLAETGFFWRERGGIKVLICRALETAGFANGFSTRLGGVSPFPENSLNLAGFDEDSAENIYENRRRFLASFGHEYRLATAWQVHGDTVKIVRDEADIANSEERADALVSDLDRVLLGVKTADCVPILLGDRKTGAFAAVHAGWRGTVQSIAVKALEKMKEVYGTHPAELLCAIGPAAGCDNYEIRQDVIDAFAEKFPTSGKYFRATRDGHSLVDLHLANKDQLLDAGVMLQNVFTAPYCTINRIDLFFSYRIEKKRYGKTGRLMSVIGKSQNRER